MHLGFKDADIAAHIGITQPALSVLKATPQFQSIMIEVTTGILSQDSQQVARTREYQLEQLTDMVPMALDNLRRFQYHPKAEIALKASLEVLDRQGDHAKVSRTDIHVDNNFDFTNVNAIGNNIMAVLKGQGVPVIPSALDSAPDPQNSTHNIDTGKIASSEGEVLEPEEDVLTRALKEFSKTADESRKQVIDMAEKVDEKTLDAIDSAKNKHYTIN